MTTAPERIWIEDEFGEGDDDQWTYGTWDVRNYAGYDVEYIRADIVQALTAERDGLLRCVTDNHVALCRAEKAEAERERLALAICGGEDAPGYANAQTVETLEHVAKQNQQSHGATINSLLAAEAERDRLREALTDAWDAHNKHGDQMSGWWVHDDALKGESHE